MYTDMDHWAEIRRRVLVDGESKRGIQREYRLHGKTLQKILNQPEPPGYQAIKPRAKKELGPFLPVIESILQQDRLAPPKQRHTAKRIFERLRDEHGYTGRLTVAQDAVRALRRQHEEVFVPLRHRPGEAQVDFGHAAITLDGVPTKAAPLVMTPPYSGALFCRAFPKECTEAFLDGHRRAFDFFGGGPGRIGYANSEIAIAKITGSRAREGTREFQRLRSHFLFAAHCCRVRRAQERGHVENLVGYARRNFLVPVPAVPSRAALNGDLEARCRQDLQRRVRGKPTGKADLPAEEAAVLLPLPKQAFAARRRRREGELEGRGAREFIKVLRRPEAATAPQLAQAVEYALGIGAISAEAVRLILEHRREQPLGPFRPDGHLRLQAVRVQGPDLAAYRGLMEEGRR